MDLYIHAFSPVKRRAMSVIQRMYFWKICSPYYMNRPCHISRTCIEQYDRHPRPCKRNLHRNSSTRLHSPPNRSVAERARTIVVDSIKACAIDDGELVTAGLKFADKIDTGRLAKKKVIQIRKGEVTMFK